MGVKTRVLRHAIEAEKLARKALHNPEVMGHARVRVRRTMLVGAAIGAGVVSALSMVLR